MQALSCIGNGGQCIAVSPSFFLERLVCLIPYFLFIVLVNYRWGVYEEN